MTPEKPTVPANLEKPAKPEAKEKNVKANARPPEGEVEQRAAELDARCTKVIETLKQQIRQKKTELIRADPRWRNDPTHVIGNLLLARKRKEPLHPIAQELLRRYDLARALRDAYEASSGEIRDARGIVKSVDTDGSGKLWGALDEYRVREQAVLDRVDAMLAQYEAQCGIPSPPRPTPTRTPTPIPTRSAFDSSSSQHSSAPETTPGTITVSATPIPPETPVENLPRLDWNASTGEKKFGPKDYKDEDYEYKEGQTRTRFMKESSPSAKDGFFYEQIYKGGGVWELNQDPAAFRTQASAMAQDQLLQRGNASREISDRFAKLPGYVQERWRTRAFKNLNGRPGFRMGAPEGRQQLENEAMRLYASQSGSVRPGTRANYDDHLTNAPLTRGEIPRSRLAQLPQREWSPPVRRPGQPLPDGTLDLSTNGRTLRTIARLVAPSMPIHRFRSLEAKPRWTEKDWEELHAMDGQVREAARQAGIPDSVLNSAVPRTPHELRRFLHLVVRASDYPAQVVQPEPAPEQPAAAAPKANFHVPKGAGISEESPPRPETPAGSLDELRQMEQEGIKGAPPAHTEWSVGALLERTGEWWRGLWKGKKIEPNMYGSVAGNTGPEKSESAPSPKPTGTDAEIVQQLLSEQRSTKDLVQYADNRNIVLGVVSHRGRALQHASDRLKSDREVVAAAVKNDSDALQYASDNLRDDPEIVRVGIKNRIYETSLKHASARLRNDKALVLEAVQAHGDDVQYASTELRNDPEVMNAATNDSPTAFQFASKELRSNKNFVLEVVKQWGNILQYAEENVKNDSDVVIAAVSNNAWALKHASARLRDDKNVVLAAVKKNGEVVGHASERLQNDADVIKLYEPHLRKGYIPPQLRDVRGAVLIAIQQSPDALRYASERLRDDRELVALALNNTTGSVDEETHPLRYASNRLRGDKELVLAAIRTEPRALQYTSDTLRDNEEIVLEAVKHDRTGRGKANLVIAQPGYAFTYASERLRNDRNFVLQVVRLNPHAFVGASQTLQEDPEILQLNKNPSSYWVQ